MHFPMYEFITKSLIEAVNGYFLVAEHRRRLAATNLSALEYTSM